MVPGQSSQLFTVGIGSRMPVRLDAPLFLVVQLGIGINLGAAIPSPEGVSSVRRHLLNPWRNL